jgi:hypothetical protein
MTTCCIFDLDGTICNTTHRQHYLCDNPKNWQAFFDACVDDEPNEHICTLYRIIEASADIEYMVICSGRPDSHREQTVKWLMDCGIMFDRLMMRKTGDYRPDHVVKKEMLEQLRNAGYQILFAVDDRLTVVNMWRSNGVPVLQAEDTTV